ncbi:beta-N-acetylhexosaminidase [Cohnella hashimotonis]|uniref:Beta-N-acetylhexosaminidase n=1 Tax=Cohnella hashimotonis TaxID=2826895 RepID=A0ABT6TKH4_9BACL|nr:beta-N-acetylhexosaminidase [Cohnella hashimotonis]MDI4646763.1 beta-N-acetylhexosaminidase [Cohnella hashimotonis]
MSNLNAGPEDLDLKRKVGQLFICGFDGHVPTDGICRLIEAYGLGGVIYFRRNLKDAAQVASLTKSLQEKAAVPLLISIDQEGGMVVRLEDGVTVMPGAMAIGAAGHAELAREAAMRAGAELRALGINMNFAPCLDVNNNPRNPVIGIRSYGEKPHKVAELGTATIGGYQESGIAAVAKHFPGHGDTAADSHHALPVVPHGRDRLDAVELVPFRAAIAAGVDAIMTAHVVFPAYEPDGVPATLSKRILTGLLRDQLGYEGVVVTDCLEMNAISETIGVARGAVEAVKGGADLILVSHRLDRQVAALEAVYEAVLAGEIPASRIEEAVRRVRALKERRGLFAGTNPAAPDPTKAAAAARKLSEQAVTVVKGEERLPLRPGVRHLVVWAEARASTEVVEAVEQSWTLGEALRAEGLDVAEIAIGLEPTEVERADVTAAAEKMDAIVFASYDSCFSQSQSALIRSLYESADAAGRAFVLTSLRTPYDLLEAPAVPVYICAYENKPAMMSALAGVLAGRLPALGRLPVTVGEYPCS